MRSATHELLGCSSFPYATSPTSDIETRAKQFSHAFKNGRGYPKKSFTFANVVEAIVKHAAGCPALAERSVLVPIPRSGNSRPSFLEDACAWPVEDLAQALAGTGHKLERLLERRTPVARSSDSKQRIPVEEHVSSLSARAPANLRNARLVLIDDVLTRGTQAMAAMLTLRRAGYQGVIQGYFVFQTIAPDATQEQRGLALQHRITWQHGQRLARRVELGSWRRPG